MIEFYLFKMLFQDDKNSMSSHQIPQIHSTQMSEIFRTTSFISSIFFNKNVFISYWKTDLGFKIWEGRILKLLLCDPFFFLLMMLTNFFLANTSTKPKQSAAVPA